MFNTRVFQGAIPGGSASLTGSVSGTTDQVNVTPNTNSVGQNITLSLPQNIAPTSTPTFDGIDFALTPTGIMQEGRLMWDATDGTLSIGLPGGNVNLQIGQEQLLRVTNKTGADIPNGYVVYVNGAQGQRPTIALADADTEIASDNVIGVTTELIANNNNGYVCVNGLVRDLNTNSFNNGDVLYLSSTAGQFTNVAPTAPAHAIILGNVIHKGISDGVVLVNIQIGQELNELHDVLMTGEAEYDGVYRNSSNLWVNSPSNTQGTETHSAGWLDRVITPTITVSGGVFNYTLTGTSIYYVSGKKYTVVNFTSGNRSMTKGNRYFFYIAPDNTQVWGSTPWDLTSLSSPTILIYYYDDTHFLPVEERHSSRRNPHHHKELHFQIGCYWIASNGGMTMADYTLDSTTLANWKFSLTEGVINDEDIASTISALASGSYNVMYREVTTGYWYWDIANAIPFKIGAASRVTYNNPTGWAQTEVGVGNCVNYYVCAFPSLNAATQIMVIQGQAMYTSEALAVNATIATDVAFGTLPSDEIKPLYQITIQSSGSGDKNFIANVKDIRASNQTLQIGSSASSGVHNSLTGLQGGAAGNYFHSDQDVNTTASPTFAGLTIASNAWKVFYSNGSSALTPLALGASGTVLQSNGASSAPSFATPTAGGGVGLETVLMLGGM